MIIAINKYVESLKSRKLFGGKTKLRGWKMIRLTWTMNNICKETVAVVPFDLGPWKFIIGWQYNPSCAYQFYIFFTSQLFK